MQGHGCRSASCPVFRPRAGATEGNKHSGSGGAQRAVEREGDSGVRRLSRAMRRRAWQGRACAPRRPGAGMQGRLHGSPPALSPEGSQDPADEFLAESVCRGVRCEVGSPWGRGQDTRTAHLGDGAGAEGMLPTPARGAGRAGPCACETRSNSALPDPPVATPTPAAPLLPPIPLLPPLPPMATPGRAARNASRS